VETANSQTSFPLAAYIPQFDGLRAFSILAVFVAHSDFLKALPNAQFLEYGRVGVDLFFVLSGFLITGILLDSKKSPHFFRNFYIRRALRIWPLYYLILFIVFLSTSLLGRNIGKSTTAVWPYFIFYLQNLFPHLNIPYGLEPTWSLAVEEQFYMTWPLLVFLLRKRTLLVLLPCLVLISLVLRIIGYENGASLKFIHNFTLCRMDALSFGSLAAIWLRSSNCTITCWRRLALLCIAVGTSGIVIARILLHQQSTIVSYTFFAISFVGLLGLSLVSDPQRSLLGRILTARWVRFTGKISYGLYLLHMPLFLQWGAFVQRHEVLTNFPFLRNTLSGLTQFAIVFVVAMISWKFIESPLLRLKSRFPSGSKIKEPI
jgi:peptidoglycan/LPS O-acetylase OafA/YrhL